MIVTVNSCIAWYKLQTVGANAKPSYQDSVIVSSDNNLSSFLT